MRTKSNQVKENCQKLKEKDKGMLVAIKFRIQFWFGETGAIYQEIAYKFMDFRKTKMKTLIKQLQY